MRRIAWLWPLFALCLGKQQAGCQQAAIDPDDRQSSKAFDVASIRLSTPGGQPSYDFTAEGFTARKTPLVWLVLLADLPLPPAYWRTNRVLQAPMWVLHEEYDVDAKVDSIFQNHLQTLPANKRDALMKPLLRSLLAERCHVKVHQEAKEEAVLGMFVRAGGAKGLMPSGSAVRPVGIDLGDGAVEVPFEAEGRRGFRFYNTSMLKLAEVLSGFETGTAPIVQDFTGLQGRFDFELYKREADDSSMEVNHASAPDPANHWEISSIGLQFKRRKAFLPVLVIDHIDKPSAN